MAPGGGARVRQTAHPASRIHARDGAAPGVCGGMAAQPRRSPTGRAPRAALSVGGLPHLPKPLMDPVLAPVFVAIVAASAGSDVAGTRSRLTSRGLVYAGEISFCFYLVHGLVIVKCCPLHLRPGCSGRQSCGRRDAGCRRPSPGRVALPAAASAGRSYRGAGAGDPRRAPMARRRSNRLSCRRVPSRPASSPETSWSRSAIPASPRRPRGSGSRRRAC